MKQRLVVFGCSYTFGVGFPDCVKGNPSSPAFSNPDRNTLLKHSKFTYPNYIAKELDLELVNKSVPGNSYKGIARSVLDFDFRDDDISIIQWTFQDRYTIFKEDTYDYNIHPTNTHEVIEKNWYKHFHSDYDAMKTSDIFIAAALSVRCHINFRCMDRFSNTPNDLDKDLHWYMDNYPRLDDGHMGEEAHREIAKDLMEIVKERVA